MLQSTLMVLTFSLSSRPADVPLDRDDLAISYMIEELCLSLASKLTQQTTVPEVAVEAEVVRALNAVRRYVIRMP